MTDRVADANASAHTTAVDEPHAQSCVLIKSGSGQAYEGKQHLRYMEGVSAQSTGAQALCMTLLTVPPGGQASAHLHEAHESAAYVISGSGEMFHGEGLREHIAVEAGDFVYIPAGAPHVVRNTSRTEPLVGILARTDPNEQESVVLLPELEAAVPPLAPG